MLDVHESLETLYNTDCVVKAGCEGTDFDTSEGCDLWFVPAGGLLPVYFKHEVGWIRSKLEGFGEFWFGSHCGRLFDYEVFVLLKN